MLPFASTLQIWLDLLFSWIYRRRANFSPQGTAGEREGWRARASNANRKSFCQPASRHSLSFHPADDDVRFPQAQEALGGSERESRRFSKGAGLRAPPQATFTRRPERSNQGGSPARSAQPAKAAEGLGRACAWRETRKRPSRKSVKASTALGRGRSSRSGSVAGRGREGEKAEQGKRSRFIRCPSFPLVSNASRSSPTSDLNKKRSLLARFTYHTNKCLSAGTPMKGIALVASEKRSSSCWFLFPLGGILSFHYSVPCWPPSREGFGMLSLPELLQTHL